MARFGPSREAFGTDEIKSGAWNPWPSSRVTQFCSIRWRRQAAIFGRRCPALSLIQSFTLLYISSTGQVRPCQWVSLSIFISVLRFIKRNNEGSYWQWSISLAALSNRLCKRGTRKSYDLVTLEFKATFPGYPRQGFAYSLVSSAFRSFSLGPIYLLLQFLLFDRHADVEGPPSRPANQDRHHYITSRPYLGLFAQYGILRVDFVAHIVADFLFQITSWVVA